MKKIRNILAMAMVVMMIVGLMPTNVFAEDTRIPISKIVATSDTDSIPVYGGTYKRPTFTVTAGDPAYFKSGHWLKKDGEEWIQYGGKTFTEGTYRYQVQIRIDGEAGTTHVLDSNGITATVDENKWAENSIPSVADTYSYDWAYSKEYEITAPVGIPLNFVKNNSWDIGLNNVGRAIKSFSVSNGAEGGEKPYTFSKVSGPDWISVGSDGTVSGTPASVGKNPDLVIRVTDKASVTKDITLTVANTVPDPSDRKKINNIVATSDTNSIPVYGGTYKRPTFTVTAGDPAYFKSGHWLKKDGETWKQYEGKTFTEGTYRYQVQIRIDGEAGTTHVIDSNGITATVDENKWAENSIPSVADTYSYAWAYSKEYVVRDSSTPLTPHNVNTSVNPEGAGTVTATPNPATFGQEVNLNITPSEGYEFNNVTLNGTAISGKSFTMPDAVANVVVNFKKDESKNTELKTFSAQTIDRLFKFNDLTITPAFAPDKKEYTASVDKTQTRIVFNLTKAVNEQTITVKMNGTDVEGLNDTNISTWRPDLVPGKNEFEFTVTAKDGHTKGAYKLTVTRGNISEAYNIKVENGKADRKKAFKGDYVTITADSPKEGMLFDKWTSVPNITFNIQNTNGSFYMPNSDVTITANYKPDPETTAYLKDIKVDTKATTGVWNNQPLSSEFKPETLSYTVNVDEDQEKLDLALYLFDKGQKVEVKKGSDTMTLDIVLPNLTREDLMVNLNKGSNVYTINVKAKTGDKTATYRVTINRGASTVTQYTVTFDANGGSKTMPNETVNEGASYILPACKFDPPAGKEFKAWEVGGVEKAVGDSIKVTENITVKATWKDKPAPTTVTITFNANGHGTAPSPITVNKGTVAAAPADPTDANYDFGGWYKEAGCTTKFDFTQAVNASITVYAKWTKKAVTPPPPTAHSITVIAYSHGSASASKSSANPGDLISISVYPDHGYVVDEIFVKDAANALISRNDYNFYMPNSAVNVYVHFKPYFYDYDYDYYRPYRPHRHTEDKKEDKKSEDKPIDKDTKKPANKVETEVILAIDSNNLDTKINGTDSFNDMDVAPYIKNGRTMLPIRYIAEALGMGVTWDAKTRTVIIEDMFYRVEIPVNTNKIIVNGKTYTSDVKPEIKNNRTMLPIANIARALGLVDGKDIIWDNVKKQVVIRRIYSR